MLLQRLFKKLRVNKLELSSDETSIENGDAVAGVPICFRVACSMGSGDGDLFGAWFGRLSQGDRS